MANRIQIRRGSGTPTSNNLLQYELGWDGTNLALYINNSGTIKKVGGEGLFLPKTGGSLSGLLTTQGNQYADSYSGAINMNNSNIFGLNAIYTADASENASEGIHFYRDTTHVDTLWMNGGDLLFVPNRALGTGTTKANSYIVLHSNNYTTYTVTKTGTGASGTWEISVSGNAATVTKLATARTLTIGSTGKTFDGSGNVSWSHAEIGATVSNTWTAGTTAGPTIKTTVNGVAGTAVAIPSASASASGVVTTGAQTFAGIKTFTNPETINTTGNGAAVNFKFSNAATANEIYGQNWISYDNTSGRFYWREWSGSSSGRTSYYEQYRLPSCNASRTSNETYEILTSKSAVTIAQGGTGATTAANAIKALLNGVATGTGVVTNDTYFIRKKDSNYSTVSAYDIATYMINQVNIQDNVLDKTANYTLAAADSGKFIVVNSSSDLTITIPTNASSSIPRGAEYTIMRQGSGKVTINSSSITAVCSTTSRNLGTKRTTLLKKIATDTWYIDGEHLSS